MGFLPFVWLRCSGLALIVAILGEDFTTAAMKPSFRWQRLVGCMVVHQFVQRSALLEHVASLFLGHDFADSETNPRRIRSAEAFGFPTPQRKLRVGFYVRHNAILS